MTRVRTNTPIRELMTEKSISLTPQMKISEAAALFTEHGIHHLPVVSGDKLVGMFSQSDLLRLDYSAALDQDSRSVLALLDATKTIKDVMTTTIVTTKENETVRDAALKLCGGNFHALPVVDADSKLLGIVTSSDMLKYLAEI